MSENNKLYMADGKTSEYPLDLELLNDDATMKEFYVIENGVERKIRKKDM